MKGTFCISVPNKEYKLCLNISRHLHHFKGIFLYIIVFSFYRQFHHESETG